MNKHPFVIHLIAALWGIIGAITFLGIPATFMVFDTEQSTKHLPTYMFAISFVTIPFVCFGSVVRVIMSTWEKQPSNLIPVILYPLIPIAVFALSFYFIEIFQGGGF